MIVNSVDLSKALEKSYVQLLSIAEGTSKFPSVRKVRDLSVIDLIGDISMIIACDSNASNGEKPNDMHSNYYEEAAVSALKVPVMEVLASGATPLVVVNNLCVEMEPTGKKIIEIMKQELESCGLWDKLQFTGSTEDNMKTTQTGIGVTVIGLVSGKYLKLGRTKPDDLVACIGFPQSGIYDRYSERDSKIAKISTVVKLSKLEYIHEILPVGSKGVRYESNELAKYVQCSFKEKDTVEIDLATSAGSSTAVLVSLDKENVMRLKNDIDEPVYEIGSIVCKKQI